MRWWRRSSSGASSTTATPIGQARARIGRSPATSVIATGMPMSCAAISFATGAGEPSITGRRPVRALQAAGAADRQSDEPVLRQCPSRRHGSLLQGGAAGAGLCPVCRRFRAVPRRSRRAGGLAPEASGVSGRAPRVVARAQDVRRADGGAGTVSRVRALVRRPAAVAGRERRPIPPSAARAARPMAGRDDRPCDRGAPGGCLDAHAEPAETRRSSPARRPSRADADGRRAFFGSMPSPIRKGWADDVAP